MSFSPVLPAPRRVSNVESNRTASDGARLFPDARFSYLKSALDAAVMLKTAADDYLNRMDNRGYHQRVRDINVSAFRRVTAGLA